MAAVAAAWLAMLPAAQAEGRHVSPLGRPAIRGPPAAGERRRLDGGRERLGTLRLHDVDRECGPLVHAVPLALQPAVPPAGHEPDAVDRRARRPGVGPRVTPRPAAPEATPAVATPAADPVTTAAPGGDFIRDIVAEDLRTGKHATIVTRFPPEPNGYLHIGHAKSICLNFGIAQETGGRCHLRFDDTNPTKEEQVYLDAIEADVRWLGFDWGEHLYHASDYFGQLYDWALELIRARLAYVDDQTADQIRENRGTLTEPGRPGPWRDRSVEENLDLFGRMRAGEFPDGSRVLRARIDMASPNINLRDPVLYRVLHATHPRTGDAWCICPMYDFAHGQSERHRMHHARPVHPRVRGVTETALRLVPGPPL